MRNWRFMRFSALLLLLVSTLAHAQSGNLPSRESLYYAVEWRLITAGKARLDWSTLPGPRGGYESKLHIESVGLVSKLFRVLDDYTSLLTPNLCVLSSHSVTHEGVRHREANITFDPATRKASYLERDTARNTTLLSQEIEIPPCVHDVIGGLYFLRTLNLEPGQAVQAPVSNGKKVVSARIEAQQREDVKTPAGTFKTIRYELFLFNNVLWSRSGHLYIWLTDDRRRIPVQIRFRLPVTIGTITLQLEKAE
jgi:antitoxin component of MazEF toxin-antitoxin module